MKRHHGDIISPFELEDRSQLHACERLEDEEQVIFLNKAVLKVMVTIRAREHDQAIWPDFLPEGFVVHRLKPFHDVVNQYAEEEVKGPNGPLTKKPAPRRYCQNRKFYFGPFLSASLKPGRKSRFAMTSCMRCRQMARGTLPLNIAHGLSGL
jgi:hypothetical protein